MRLARRAIHQRAEIVLGTGHRDVLEHIAAGIHQRDHRAGERLAERERRAHRHQRDRIDAEPAGQEIPDDRDRQSRHDRRGREPPEEVGEVGPAGGVSANAGRQPDHRDRDECPPQDALKCHRLFRADASSGLVAENAPGTLEGNQARGTELQGYASGNEVQVRPSRPGSTSRWYEFIRSA